MLEVTELELGVPNNVLLVPPPNILLPAVDVAPNTFLEDDSAGGLEPRLLRKFPPPPNILLPLDVAVDFVSVFPPKIEVVEAADTVDFSDTCNELPPKIDVEEVLLAKVVMGEDAT